MKKLTKKEEKRVEILKDVLKHLKTQRIIATRGHVLTYENQSPTECNMKEENIQKFIKLMNRKKKPCSVCVRGSILFSSIWKNNKFYKDFSEDNYINDSNRVIVGVGTASFNNKENEYLEKLFEKHQLALMERAFENDYNSHLLSVEEMEKCELFYDRYYTQDARLTAIIKNAIENRGTFIP